jgi:putative chitinase
VSITVDTLIAAGIGPLQAEGFAPWLQGVCTKSFGLTTSARIAAFVAQAAHESARFTRTEENLHYSTASRIRAMWPRRVPTELEAQALCGKPEDLANRVYSNRLGNGDEMSGDGWNYRGRGLFQLTGRANYMAAEEALNRPYKEQPELVADPQDACITAAWYWQVMGCNQLIDQGAFDLTTMKINGQSMVGALERSRLFAQALEAFA